MNAKIREDVDTILADNNIVWDKFKNSSILITGATGLIGSLLSKTLIAYKDRSKCLLKIYALVRNIEKLNLTFGQEYKQTGIIPVVGDVRNPIEALEPIEYIIHCASPTASKYMATNPVETLEALVWGTENVLELAKKSNLKGMVYLSSMEVYGIMSERNNPMTEEKLGYIDLHSPRSSYSEGKRICECMCNAYASEYGVPVMIARLAQTFGAGMPLTDNRVPMQFARSAIRGQNIVLHTAGKSVSNFCYTTDALRGLLTLLTQGNPGDTYNICNDEETRSIAEIAELVATQVAGGKIKIIYDIADENTFGYAPDTAIRLCSDKLRRLGWEAEVDMESAYRRLIDYLKSEEK